MVRRGGRWADGMKRDRTRRNRWLRRALTCLAGLAALLTLIVSMLVIALHSFDRAWLKQRLQNVARTSARLDVDYRDIQIDLFSGAVIDGLVVRSPAEFRAAAPELLRIGHIAARWSLRSLAFGRGPAIEGAVLSDVSLTIAIDEHGRTSLDALNPQRAPSAPSPNVPLSQWPSRLLGSAPPVAELSITHVALASIRTERGRPVERTELQGLSLAVRARPDRTKAGWLVDAALGTQTTPLDLTLSRKRSGASARSARARLWFNAHASSSALRASIDLHMLDQTFFANVSADHGLHAAVDVRFDPVAGQTEIAIDRVEAGEHAAILEASLEIADGGTTSIRRARGDIDLAQLIRWLPEGLVPVTAARAQLHFDVDSLALGKTIRLSKAGQAQADVELSDVAIDALASPIAVRAAKLSLHAEQPASEGVAAAATFTITHAQMARLEMDDVALDLAGTQEANGAIDAHASLRFARAAASGSIARGGQIELRSQRLQLAEDPLQTRGDLSLKSSLRSLAARASTVRALADDSRLAVHVELQGHAPYAAELELAAAQARVQGGDGKLLASGPAEIEVQARDLEPDLANPIASRATLHAAFALGDSR
ncbi:MAG TPA: hypothetical protein VGI70_13935, partial [Polyangiales bacterium]